MPPVGTCTWCGIKLRAGACINTQCVLHPLTLAQASMSKQPPEGVTHDDWRHRYLVAQGQ